MTATGGANSKPILLMIAIAVVSLMFAFDAGNFMADVAPQMTWQPGASPALVSVDPNLFADNDSDDHDPALPAFAQCYRIWFPRMRTKRQLVVDGNATLHWAHMRKAGGTTFQSYIESVNERLLTYLRGVRDGRKGVELSTPLAPTSLFTQGFARTIRPHLQANSR